MTTTRASGAPRSPATSTTDANGNYTFTGLAAGEYRLLLDEHPGMVALQDQGGDDALDSDFNQNGYTDPFTLAAGDALDLDVGLYGLL